MVRIASWTKWMKAVSGIAAVLNPRNLNTRGSPDLVLMPVIDKLSNDPDPRSRSIPATHFNEFHSAALKLDWPQTAMSKACRKW